MDFVEYAPRFFWDPATDRMYIQTSRKPVTRQDRISDRCTEDYAEDGDFCGVELHFPEGFSAALRGAGDPASGGGHQPLPPPSPLVPRGSGRPPSPRNVAGPEQTDRVPRGRRLPDDWEVTDEMREWAEKEAPGVDVDRANQVFVDYWLSLPGERSTKIDWRRTWNNWMRKEAGRPARGRPPKPTEATSDRKARETQELKKFFRGQE